MNRKQLAVLIATLALILAPVTQATTVLSNTVTVQLSLSIPEQITVVPSTQTVQLTSTDGKHFGATGASVTTSWSLTPGHTSLQVSAYFTGANAFDGGSSGSIPTSAFFVGTGNVSAGPCNQAGPFSTNSCPLLENIASPAATGSKTDVFNFGTSDLSTLTPAIAAGTFVGTLNVEAIAN